MKAVHHDSIHNFFQSFSRVVIIFPVVIVFIAILLKIFQSDAGVIKSKITPTITQSALPSIVPSNNIMDLKGPSTCLFQSKEASWSAFIQNRMVLAVANEKTKTTYHLLKDDCLYIWEKQKYSGEKMCGISQFLSIGEGLFNSGFMNENMFGMLLSQSKINLPLPFQFKDIQKIISTCKQSGVFPLSQFELPNKVLFKSK